jgi:DNA-binding MarR family transcriptional regulator
MNDKRRAKNGRRIAALDLDALVHERLRLGMLSVLAVNDSMSFTELRESLGTTDGNLIAHARRLEDAGYIAAEKGRNERRTCTTYRITPRGRMALERYVQMLERVLPPAPTSRRIGEGEELSAAALSKA